MNEFASRVEKRAARMHCFDCARKRPGRSGDFQNPSHRGQGSASAKQAKPETAFAVRLAPDLFVRNVFEHDEDLTRVFVTRPRDVFRGNTRANHDRVVVLQVTFDVPLPG